MEQIIDYVYHRCRRMMNSPKEEKRGHGFCTIQTLFPELIETLNISFKASDDEMDGLRVLFIVTYFAMKKIDTVKSEKETSDMDEFMKLVTQKWPDAVKFFYYWMFGLDKSMVCNQCY